MTNLLPNSEQLLYERTTVHYLQNALRSVKPLSETDHPIHPRKLEIVQAAVMCFLEQGYHQTGVRDIARRAGISLGNLYNHFKGKDAVLAFIAEIEGAELSGFIEHLSGPANPLERLEGFITAYATYAAQPENALLGVEILTESLRNPTVAEAFGNNRSRLIDALAGCLTDGMQSGVFVPYDDKQAAARMILDTLEGHGLAYLFDPENSARSVPTLLAFLINGLKNAPPR